MSPEFVERSVVFVFRDYVPGDEADVFQIVKDVLAGYGLTANPEKTDADLGNIRASYVSCGGAFRIIEHEGRIVGSYGLYPETSQSCELRKMYVLPQFKGQGLGKRMMEDALALTKGKGFVEMTLETNSRLKEEMGLYKKYGFAEFAPEHLSDRCDLAMKKTL